MIFRFQKITEEIDIAARSGPGMWVFILHRITGLSLIFYLLLHILVISTSIKGPAAFDNLLAVLTTPFFMLLDLGLLAAVLFHGLNGIRILLFDIGMGIRRQKFIFWVLMLAAASIWTVTFYWTLPHILGK